MGFNVSCSTSLPKSHDRIAETIKPRKMARLYVFDMETIFPKLDRPYCKSRLQLSSDDLVLWMTELSIQERWSH